MNYLRTLRVFALVLTVMFIFGAAESALSGYLMKRPSTSQVSRGPPTNFNPYGKGR